MDKIWKSELPDELRRDFFKATTVEYVLVNRGITLTKPLEKKINGSYTRMLPISSPIAFSPSAEK